MPGVVHKRGKGGCPNLLRLQMLTGWVVCRVLCINAERVVVRICHGRGCWQAVRSAGLGSTGGCGCVFAGRQACGQKSNPTPFSIMPAHLRHAQKPNRRPHSYRALQPYGLFRGRNGVPLIRSRVLAGAVWWVRRYIRKRNGFPNRLRLQVVTGWVVCRVLCINAERVVVRICHGRGCWQAVRSAGLGSTGGCGCVFAGRQACGQKSNPTPFSIMPAHLRHAQKPNRRPHSYRALQP